MFVFALDNIVLLTVIALVLVVVTVSSVVPQDKNKVYGSAPLGC